jgi:dUTP pyrophosphatase
MDINVKYFGEDVPRLVKNDRGDWIDLSVSNAFVVDNNEYSIKLVIKHRITDHWGDNDRLWFDKGSVVVMRFGVAIELPYNKKANVLARSSLFASYGLILTNGVGCIDHVYKGNDDEWIGVFYCTREGYITQYDRVCQFEATDRMDATLHEVDELGSLNRNGYGTSGKQ